MMVRVATTPRGEAPLWVRKAWVGVVLPVQRRACRPVGVVGVVGVVTGEPVHDRPVGYCVPASEAVEVLRATDPVAAAWWDRMPGYRVARGNFVFGLEECEVVEP